MKNRLKPLFISFLIVMLIVLAGCQAVGEFDINQAMLSNLNVNSQEGKANVSVQLTQDDTAAAAEGDKEALGLIALFQNASLNLYNMKVQDSHTFSTDGDFQFSKGKIPFSLSMTSKELALQLEGAVRPIVFNLGDALGGTSVTAELQGLQDKLMAQSKELVKSLGSYVITNLPNPGKVAVSSVDQTINGETLSLHQIHAEIYGSELLGLVRKLLVNLVNDEAGLREMLSQLYDILIPIIQPVLDDAMKSSAEGAAPDPTTTLISNMMKNKTLAVEFLLTTIKTALEPLIAEFDSYVKKLNDGVDPDEIKSILNDDNYLKVDMFVDNDMVVRKTQMELMISPKLKHSDRLKSVKINVTSESWNINKPVISTPVDSGDHPFSLGAGSKPVLFINSVKENSLLYDVLKNDLHITRKKISMILDKDSLQEGQQTGYQKPYIKNKTTMVPAAFLSEQLDANVKWDAEKHQVTIVDDLSGTYIEFTIGSKVALVNGIEYTLRNPAELRYGRSFVPVAFIAESLGATVHWNNETKSITITRE